MTPIENNPKEVFFPTLNSWVDWNSLAAAGRVAERTELLRDQHQELMAVGSKKIYPHCDCSPGARFTVRKNEQRDRTGSRDIYRLVRMPRSGPEHASECVLRSDAPSGLGGQTSQVSGRVAGRDFAAAMMELADPENMEVREATSKDTASRKKSATGGNGGKTASLRRFAKELLQTSGVCEWQPQFAGVRDQRVFNGLICGAVEKVRQKARWMRLLADLREVEVVAWSRFNPALRTENSLLPGDAVVAFGFLESLSSANENGARTGTFSGCAIPIVLPRALLVEAARNPEEPIDVDEPRFPLWCIYVARLHAGEWKAHAFEGFRVSRRGVIPISSNEEERMVQHLLDRNRCFTRWLVAPPGLADIPDFELTDTPSPRYIEVAGRMDDPKYAQKITIKIGRYPDLIVWDTRRPIESVSLPERQCPRGRNRVLE